MVSYGSFVYFYYAVIIFINTLFSEFLMISSDCLTMRS